MTSVGDNCGCVRLWCAFGQYGHHQLLRRKVALERHSLSHIFAGRFGRCGLHYSGAWLPGDGHYCLGHRQCGCGCVCRREWTITGSLAGGSRCEIETRCKRTVNRGSDLYSRLSTKQRMRNNGKRTFMGHRRWSTEIYRTAATPHEKTRALLTAHGAS